VLDDRHGRRESRAQEFGVGAGDIGAGFT
jgi:hypothetical protein